MENETCPVHREVVEWQRGVDVSKEFPQQLCNQIALALMEPLPVRPLQNLVWQYAVPHLLIRKRTAATMDKFRALWDEEKCVAQVTQVSLNGIDDLLKYGYGTIRLDTWFVVCHVLPHLLTLEQCRSPSSLRHMPLRELYSRLDVEAWFAVKTDRSSCVGHTAHLKQADEEDKQHLVQLSYRGPDCNDNEIRDVMDPLDYYSAVRFPPFDQGIVSRSSSFVSGETAVARSDCYEVRGREQNDLVVHFVTRVSIDPLKPSWTIGISI